MRAKFRHINLVILELLRPGRVYLTSEAIRRAAGSNGSEGCLSQIQKICLPLLVVLAVCGLVGWAALGPMAHSGAGNGAVAELDSQIARDLNSTVENVDRFFQSRWEREQIIPAGPAEELQVLRRLSLALVGTVPSLQEIREFEADASPGRVRRWTERLLGDRRFAEYFAKRLAVAFAGNFEQKVPWFRHARFEEWLAEQVAAGRPYDEMVRQMVSTTGPPTSNGAGNFVTAEIEQGEQFANRLAARSTRAFLGQRIDCAECHDHPFDNWKQADFEGLAAHFSQVRTGAIGIEDAAHRQYEVEDRKTLEKHVVEPRVPFHGEWRSDEASRREQLATWLVHRENRRFWRAISNRVWGLMFGQPFVVPVDSIPDPVEAGDMNKPDSLKQADETELLDVLANDLREHGGDLRRLVLVIALSRPFQLASTHAKLDAASATEYERLTNSWAVFPLVQLRPEQLASSLNQAASLRTLQANEDVVTLIRRELWMRKFIEEYGSLGENELAERTDSIPQTIQRMHSRFTREKSRVEWTSSAGRIAGMAPNDSECLEACYLVCLTRRPTDAERDHFLPQLQAARSSNRSRVVEDIYWALFNSPEFGWDH